MVKVYIDYKDFCGHTPKTIIGVVKSTAQIFIPRIVGQQAVLRYVFEAADLRNVTKEETQNDIWYYQEHYINSFILIRVFCRQLTP